MKTIFLTVAFSMLCSFAFTQTPWAINLNNVSIGPSNIGTSNNRSLNFFTNNNKRMILDSTGILKISSLTGEKYRLIYADSAGNIFRVGSGNPSIPSPGSPCSGYAGPWYEGGNIVNTPGMLQTIGTCNNYDFILKANGLQSVFIKPSGKVGVGISSPAADFEVFDPGSLATDGATALLTAEGMVVNSNHFKHSTWIIRDDNLLDDARIHDGIYTGSTYGTPGTDTKTWWERWGSNDLQAWGNGTTTYMKLLSSGRFSLGNYATASDASILNLNSNGLNPFEVFDVSIGQKTFKIAQNGKTIIGYQAGSGNLALANINIAGGSTPTNALDLWDQYSGKVNFRIKSNGYVFCREVNVMPTTITFPDYVFEKGYELIPLEKLENYILENKHLSNIPSATEIQREGLNIADMQVRQMEKIEEAFLYIIELKKENDLLKARLTELENQK